jgi:hypothetical protein
LHLRKIEKREAVHNFDRGDEACSKPMANQIAIDAQNLGELAYGVEAPYLLFGSKEPKPPPKLMFGENFNRIPKELKLPSFQDGTRRACLIIQRKLALTDNEVSRMPHGRAIDSSAEIQHKPP